MANICSVSQLTFKWTMKLFFHFLDLTILNSWIWLSSCGAKCTHEDYTCLGKECDHRSWKKLR